ncbi:hypothetical protein B566_EDAN003743 [Ephemera danica]|nr:hypothetical protein B566_EDAN003743 [Ephemera danica]
MELAKSLTIPRIKPSTKKFHVCEFNNLEVGIVPNKWLTKEDAAKCWYPPTSQQTMTTIQKALTPQKNWNIFGVKRTFKVTENLSEAVKLMDHYANTSATDEASPNAKRRKSNKNDSSPLNISFPTRDHSIAAKLTGSTSKSPTKRRLSFEKSTNNKKNASFPLNITSNATAIQKELLLTTPEKSTVDSDADSPGKKRNFSRFSPSYVVDYSAESDDSDVPYNSPQLSRNKQTKNVETDDRLKKKIQSPQSPHNGKNATTRSSNTVEKNLTTLQKLANEYNSPTKQSPANKSPKRMQFLNTTLASAETPQASTSNEQYDFSTIDLSPIVPFRSSALNPDTSKSPQPSTFE